uniref:Uncharacterized protein n=1 Tax=Serinus canaria TaxID=9135 RepID=A0A8C9L3F1_SERCA
GTLTPFPSWRARSIPPWISSAPFTPSWAFPSAWPWPHVPMDSWGTLKLGIVLSRWDGAPCVLCPLLCAPLTLPTHPCSSWSGA